MKLATFVAAALAVASTSALAEGEALSLNGFSLGGEVASEYKVDAEQFTVVLTPEAKYTLGDTAFTASTDLSVWDSVAEDNFTLMNALDDGSYPALEPCKIAILLALKCNTKKTDWSHFLHTV